MEWDPGSVPSLLWQGALSSGPPRKTIENLMFQACPQATKSHQTWSRSHRKPCKNDTEINRIPTSVKSVFLQHFPHQIPSSGHGSSAPGPHGKPSKIIKFQACLQASKSHQNWSQSHRKPCKNDTKINIIPTYVKS